MLLEIIVTTYGWMIYKTHVFSLYCHLYIFVSMYLYSYQIYPWYIWSGGRRGLRAIQGVPEDDHQVNFEMQLWAVIKQVWKCTWQGWYWVNSEMHLEAVIKRVRRYAWGLGASEQREALGAQDRVRLEMNLETTIMWSWRPWLSEFEDTPGGHEWVSIEMHSKAMIEWVWKCTCTLWSRTSGGVLGCGQSEGSRL